MGSGRKDNQLVIRASRSGQNLAPGQKPKSSDTLPGVPTLSLENLTNNHITAHVSPEVSPVSPATSSTVRNIKNEKDGTTILNRVDSSVSSQTDNQDHETRSDDEDDDFDQESVSDLDLAMFNLPTTNEDNTSRLDDQTGFFLMFPQFIISNEKTWEQNLIKLVENEVTLKHEDKTTSNATFKHIMIGNFNQNGFSYLSSNSSNQQKQLFYQTLMPYTYQGANIDSETVVSVYENVTTTKDTVAFYSRSFEKVSLEFNKDADICELSIESTDVGKKYNDKIISLIKSKPGYDETDNFVENNIKAEARSSSYVDGVAAMIDRGYDTIDLTYNFPVDQSNWSDLDRQTANQINSVASYIYGYNQSVPKDKQILLKVNGQTFNFPAEANSEFTIQYPIAPIAPIAKDKSEMLQYVNQPWWQQQGQRHVERKKEIKTQIDALRNQLQRRPSEAPTPKPDSTVPRRRSSSSSDSGWQVLSNNDGTTEEQVSSLTPKSPVHRQNNNRQKLPAIKTDYPDAAAVQNEPLSPVRNNSTLRHTPKTALKAEPEKLTVPMPQSNQKVWQITLEAQGPEQTSAPATSQSPTTPTSVTLAVNAIIEQASKQRSTSTGYAQLCLEVLLNQGIIVSASPDKQHIDFSTLDNAFNDPTANTISLEVFKPKAQKRGIEQYSPAQIAESVIQKIHKHVQKQLRNQEKQREINANKSKNGNNTATSTGTNKAEQTTDSTTKPQNIVEIGPNVEPSVISNQDEDISTLDPRTDEDNTHAEGLFSLLEGQVRKAVALDTQASTIQFNLTESRKYFLINVWPELEKNKASRSYNQITMLKSISLSTQAVVLAKIYLEMQSEVAKLNDTVSNNKLTKSVLEVVLGALAVSQGIDKPARDYLLTFTKSDIVCRNNAKQKAQTLVELVNKTHEEQQKIDKAKKGQLASLFSPGKQAALVAPDNVKEASAALAAMLAATTPKTIPACATLHTNTTKKMQEALISGPASTAAHAGKSPVTPVVSKPAPAIPAVSTAPASNKPSILITNLHKTFEEIQTIVTKMDDQLKSAIAAGPKTHTIDHEDIQHVREQVKDSLDVTVLILKPNQTVEAGSLAQAFAAPNVAEFNNGSAPQFRTDRPTVLMIRTSKTEKDKNGKEQERGQHWVSLTIMPITNGDTTTYQTVYVDSKTPTKLSDKVAKNIVTRFTGNVPPHSHVNFAGPYQVNEECGYWALALPILFATTGKNELPKTFEKTGQMLLGHNPTDDKSATNNESSTQSLSSSDMGLKKILAGKMLIQLLTDNNYLKNKNSRSLLDTIKIEDRLQDYTSSVITLLNQGIGYDNQYTFTAEQQSKVVRTVMAVVQSEISGNIDESETTITAIKGCIYHGLITVLEENLKLKNRAADMSTIKASLPKPLAEFKEILYSANSTLKSRQKVESLMTKLITIYKNLAATSKNVSPSETGRLGASNNIATTSSEKANKPLSHPNMKRAVVSRDKKRTPKTIVSFNNTTVESTSTTVLAEVNGKASNAAAIMPASTISTTANLPGSRSEDRILRNADTTLRNLDTATRATAASVNNTPLVNLGDYETEFLEIENQVRKALGVESVEISPAKFRLDRSRTAFAEIIANNEQAKPKKNITVSLKDNFTSNTPSNPTPNVTSQQKLALQALIYTEMQKAGSENFNRNKFEVVSELIDTVLKHPGETPKDDIDQLTNFRKLASLYRDTLTAEQIKTLNESETFADYYSKAKGFYEDNQRTSLEKNSTVTQLASMLKRFFSGGSKVSPVTATPTPKFIQNVSEQIWIDSLLPRVIGFLQKTENSTHNFPMAQLTNKMSEKKFKMMLQEMEIFIKKSDNKPIAELAVVSTLIGHFLKSDTAMKLANSKIKQTTSAYSKKYFPSLKLDDDLNELFKNNFSKIEGEILPKYFKRLGGDSEPIDNSKKISRFDTAPATIATTSPIVMPIVTTPITTTVERSKTATMSQQRNPGEKPALSVKTGKNVNDNASKQINRANDEPVSPVVPSERTNSNPKTSTLKSSPHQGNNPVVYLSPETTPLSPPDTPRSARSSSGSERGLKAAKAQTPPASSTSSDGNPSKTSNGSNSPQNTSSSSSENTTSPEAAASPQTAENPATSGPGPAKLSNEGQKSTQALQKTLESEPLLPKPY